MIEKPTKIYLGFTKKSNLWWVKLLCRKYRHIIIILEFNKKYLIIEPAFNRWEFGITSKRFLKLLKENDWNLIETKPNDKQMKNYFFNPSCVSVAKAVLGIHNPFIKTPKQLLNKINS